MLIINETLGRALSQFKFRNQLIKSLDLSADHDENQFYKLVMAFWLGSNVTLNLLYDKHEIKSRNNIGYLLSLYHCTLILDKQMSLLETSNPAYQIMQKALNNIFLTYNSNYLLLTEAPETLFQNFLLIIEDLSSDSVKETRARLILEQAKKSCFIELFKILNSRNVSIAVPPCYEITEISNDLRGWDWYNPRKLTTGILKVQTASYSRHLFGSIMEPTAKAHIHRFILPAYDGILLEGTHVPIKNQHTNTVVLALIGHFPTEKYYISDHFIQFQNLFKTDVVFINHRNYSARSARMANSIDDLTQDVISFVNYFRKQNKDIVLYGMCGGAAHMLLAANKLQEGNIPFKLIIDRFSQRYYDFRDIKTIKRKNEYRIAAEITPGSTPVTIPVFILILFFLLVKLSLHLTKTNINFAALARNITEKDLLILQAKGPKTPGSPNLLCTDLWVHPDNDIRNAIKDLRHQRKDLLKTLRAYSRKIHFYAESEELQSIFLQFVHFFNLSLQLITNEKLTRESPPGLPTDIHSYKLFDLTTRDNLKPSKLITGFFNKPPVSSAQYIKLLTSFSEEEILDFFDINPLVQQTDHKPQQFAFFLSSFLKTIQENKDYISHIADRLFSTQMGNIIEPIKALSATPLFTSLSEKSTYGLI